MDYFPSDVKAGKLQDQTTDQKNYDPSDAEKDVIARVYKRFRYLQQMRNAQFRFFNGMTLTSYVDASVKRMSLFTEQPVDDDDWQAKTVMTTTRDKANAILAHIYVANITPEFEDTQRNDPVRPHIARGMYMAAIDAQEKRGDHIQFDATFSAVEKGTCVTYEGFQVKKAKIKKISKYDPLTGDVDYSMSEEILWSDCESEILDLLDFFPGDLTKTNVQRMPDCAWRTFVDIDTFKIEFGHYKNANFVKVGGDASDMSFFKDYISKEVGKDKVEILRYFSKVDDEFHILANGVLLTKVGNPLPWVDKLEDRGMPFWVNRFEIIDEKFFYGMSLPFKVKGHQDVLDIAYRMMINSAILTGNSPILTDDTEMEEEYNIHPGGIKYHSRGSTAVQMDFGPSTEAAYRLAQFASRNADEATVDDTSAGIGGNKGVSATQSLIASQEAKKLISLFSVCLEQGVQARAYLVTSRILQFYHLPLAEGKYRKLTLPNLPLIGDERSGTVEIIFVPNKAALPAQKIEVDTPNGMVEMPMTDELKAEIVKEYGIGADEISIERTLTGQKISITPNALKDLTLGITVRPNSVIKPSEESKQAKFRDFETSTIQFYGDIIDRKKLFRKKAQMADQDATEFLTDPNNQQPAQPIQPSNDPNGPSGLGDMNSQMMEGAKGAGQADKFSLNAMAGK